MYLRIVLPLVVAFASPGLAGHAHAEFDVLRRGEIESTLSARMSGEDVSVALAGCVVNVAALYPTQCFPGVDVGMVSKYLTIDLREYDLRVRASTIQSDTAVISFEPNSDIAEAIDAAAEEERGVVLSSGTLPPIERHKLIYETVIDLLELHGIRSRVVVKSCVGEKAIVPASYEMRIEVPQHAAPEIRHDLEAYVASFCGDAI